ncbi:hypothetical protein SSX86_010541 [Deinandra increscens subsp. villosa]|uniref:Uncharacterized protein n=1 Tax=Deinandra increscens subsp. villosa TaxID=3103831 RepID=A0AAP0H2M7_9ASTR
MVGEQETPNGHVYDSICNMACKTEANDDDSGGLLVDGSSGGTSSEGVRTYKRRKLRKLSNLDEITKREFDDKINDADGTSGPVQDKQMLSFGAFTNGPSECSLRHNSNIVLPQMHQPRNGHEDGFGGYYQENGCMSEIKKSHDNQTTSSAQQLPHVMSCGLLKQSEGSTSSEYCWDALSDIQNSDEFSELSGLLVKNLCVVNVNEVFGIDTISLKIKNGVYETSPTLYVKDIQQAWTKFQQVCNKMNTLITSLSDRSRSHYEQFFRKPRSLEAPGCKACGEKADVNIKRLVCDSCEDIYHLSCSELVGTEIPPSSSKWYCANCVSNGIGSPHDNCIVCEKLKSEPHVNGVPTQDVPNGSGEHSHSCNITDEKQSSNICFICKNEVKLGDNFRTCGNSACGHKYFHHKCLTSKQLGVFGPCWYCPSCLCRRCLIDENDDKIILCEFCDEAYHIYCVSPPLLSIPEGNWFCGKCDRELKRIRTQRELYESIQKRVKVEDGSEKAEHEEGEAMMSEREGLDMLVTAAKTLSHRDTFWSTR